MAIRRKGPYVIWRVTVPEHIAAEIELSIADPIRGKPMYGVRSQLITQLLTNYIDQLKAEAKEANYGN